MFKNTYQSGFLSILYSIGSKPLQIWEKESTHVAKSSSQRPHQKTNWPGHSIFCLGNHGHQRHHCLHNFPSKSKRNSRHQATLPCHDHQECTFFITQLKKYFTFEVQVLDDKNVRRRFRASNYQSTTRVKPFICTMPMRLD